MSPDLEAALRELYPDLITAATEFSIPDGWVDIVDRLLGQIREAVGDGRIAVIRFYTDAEEGFLRVAVRGAQLEMRILMRCYGLILKSRWHSVRTRESLLHRYRSVLAEDFVLDLRDDDYAAAKNVLESFVAEIENVDRGRKITAIRSVTGGVEIATSEGSTPP